MERDTRTHHFLNSLKQFVHEFKELENHSLKESPVISEEIGILPDHVHDVGGNYSLQKSESEKKKKIRRRGPTNLRDTWA